MIGLLLLVISGGKRSMLEKLVQAVTITVLLAVLAGFSAYTPMQFPTLPIKAGRLQKSQIQLLPPFLTHWIDSVR